MTRWALRCNVQGSAPLHVKTFTGTGLAGGLIGAALLLMTPITTFAGLVPYLMLFATLRFAFGKSRPIGLSEGSISAVGERS